ncbi:daunorubicin resistance protein DrrA family ABC transporter ATP-binding protein [Winogradskya consettensis]|uniref:Daunorubicin resistance protein DrrA family ABC transporter ATP-binding protein n=1 Tax=Winogradskya consettensis TaxID=113560 RepID=A0A919SZN1_9ACTN|nr:ATP-binding cassette domain-containing protein [Actinoplanes consettensis]GIM82390.1 daunorubicin resistance protein DrrA family ABC transporter ATP-binding protein [Actinoplanes consettensis]
MIEVRGLRKTYKLRIGGQKTSVDAVKGVTFSVPQGGVLGLLGSNGAGKTTTMRMLTTLIRPDGGEATIAGADLIRDPGRVRRQIGYVAQGGSTWDEATVREELLMHARMYGLSKAEAQTRVARTVDAFGMTAYADRRCRTLSGGQRRRADIAMGLINEPRVLFLDEPTASLDPAGRIEIRDQVRALREFGVTVLITTHYLEEADALCDRIAIVDKGSVVADGTPAELKSEVAGDVVTLGFDGGLDAAVKVLDGAPYVNALRTGEDKLRLNVSSGSRTVPAILRDLEAAGITPATIEVHRPTLDDVFRARAGRPLQES